MKRLRYLFYVAFALAALLFWPLVLGIVPIGDPQCAFEPQGCEPATWQRVLNGIKFWGATPATALAFIFYRRWVRHLFGLEE